MIVEFVVPEFAAADGALEDIRLGVIHFFLKITVNGFVFQQQEAFYLVVDLIGA